VRLLFVQTPSRSGCPSAFLGTVYAREVEAPRWSPWARIESKLMHATTTNVQKRTNVCGFLIAREFTKKLSLGDGF
jgi:hypothetical protein